MINSSVCEKKQAVRTHSSVTSLLISIIVGFITATSTVAGIPSTLNIAVCASVNFSNGICILAGSLFSYLFMGQVSASLGQICAMLTLIAIKFVSQELLERKRSVLVNSLTAGLIFIFYSTGFMFIYSYSLTKQLVIIAQGLIAGASTYFLICVLEYIQNNKALPVAGFTGASLGVILVFIVTSLTSIDIWRFNIGRIVGIFVMLLIIKKYNFIGGAISGVLTCCGITLCSTSLGKTAMLLATAGIIAGLFSKFGSFAMISSFIVSNFIGMLALGITGDTFNFMFDIAVATVIYIIIPSSSINRLFDAVGFSKYSGVAVAQNAGSRLDFASKTIQDVNLSLKEITDAMEQKRNKNTFTAKVCKKICDNCPNNLECWQKRYSESIYAFNDMEKIIKHKKDIPNEYFLNRLYYCTSKKELKQCCCDAYSEYRNELIQEKSLKDMRDLLSDQFYAMEEMLTSLGKQLTNYSMSDQELSLKATQYFKNRAVTDPRVCVYKNAYGFLELEAFIPQNITFNDETLCNDLSDMLDVELEMPHFNEMGGLTRIEMWQKPEYEIEIGATQMCGSGDEMTGDSYETFFDNQAQAFIVLSDGMGSGKRAQLDSLLASSLISRLIRAGVGYSSALRLINSSMRVKSWEESFATVDIAIINLYNTTLSIIKAGASATYILRKDELKRIQVNSLPIGILKEVKTEKTTVKLKDGDIIITASDGLEENCLDIVRRTVIPNKHLNANLICEKIMNAVQSVIKNLRTDDITIIVSKFTSAT